MNESTFFNFLSPVACSSPVPDFSMHQSS